MANTAIQLKKSGQTGNTPVDLQHGEVAINYADGKLYYKDDVGSIQFIQNQDTFGTINVDGSLIIATSPTDILSIKSGNNISVGVDTGNNSLTINSTVNTEVIFSKANSAGEVAQAAFDKANTANITYTSSNTSPTSPKLGDEWYKINEDILYVYSTDGSSDFWLDITSASLKTSDSEMLDSFARTTANAAFLAANNGTTLAQNAYNRANSAVTLTQIVFDLANTNSVTTQIVFDSSNTKYSKTGGEINGDVTITGNLTVSGAKVINNTQEMTVHDNIIYLNEAQSQSIINAVGDGANVVYTTANTHGFSLGGSIRVTGITPTSLNLSSSNTIIALTSNTFTVSSAVTEAYSSGGTAYYKVSANPDLGWAGGYNDGTYHHAGMFRDASDGIFKVFYNYTPEPDASVWIDTNDSSFLIANLTANLITDVISLRGLDPLNYANTKLSLSGGTITGNITLSNKPANTIPYLNSSNTITSGPELQFDGKTLRLGEGTPSSWYSGHAPKMVEFADDYYGSNSSIGNLNGTLYIINNAVEVDSGIFQYQSSLEKKSTAFLQSDSTYTWLVSSYAGFSGDTVAYDKIMRFNGSSLSMNGFWDWNNSIPNVDLASVGSFYVSPGGILGNDVGITQNAYNDSSGNWAYSCLDSTSPNRFVLNKGSFIWENSVAGSVADNFAGWQRKMTLTYDGDLVVGSDTSNISGITNKISSNNVTGFATQNANANTAAYTTYQLGNNNGQNRGGLSLFGSGWTTSNLYKQDGLYLYTSGAGGISIATEASTPIYFATNNTERGRFDSSGRFLLNNTNGTYRLTIVEDGGTNTNTSLTGSGLVIGRTNGYSEAIGLRTLGTGSTGISGSSFAGQIQGNGVNALEMYTSGNAPIVFGTAGVENVRIAYSGFVGIKETNPASPLTVRRDSVGGRGGEISIVNYATSTLNNSAALNFGLEGSTYHDDNGNAQIKAIITNAGTSASDLTFSTWNGSAFGERTRISSAGGWSVGTTANPGAGAIYATGNITAYYSDGRLKDVTGKIENALSKVEKLSGIYYKNNSLANSFGYTDNEIQVGVIAQDVEKVLPEIVRPAPFDLDENNNSKSGENYKTIQYERIVPLLIEAIKELKLELDSLKGVK